MTTQEIIARALYGQELIVPSSSKTYEVSFIEGSRLCGSALWPAQYSHEQAHIPYSRAYFCRTCGDVWARILIHENPSDWHAIFRACRKHTERLSPIAGGTFFDPQLQENFDIPKNILAEDFLFLMSLYDKLADSYIP